MRSTGTQGADEPWPPPAGWFGKIPSLGDFVVRRIPPDFVEAWDEWLSTEIFATRQALGSEWPRSYLNSPTWRFVLMPGVLGARSWYGVLAPSVDRVGRHFPLTLVAPDEAPVGETRSPWSTLIAGAIRARGPDCDADDLDAVLVSTTERENAGPIQDDGERALRDALACAQDGSSLWAPWQPESRARASVLTFQGLPQGLDFLKLIAG